YFAHPKLLKRLFWWQDINASAVRAWRDELVCRNEIELIEYGWCCYTNHRATPVAIVNPRRFQRFSSRGKISDSLRFFVYERDGWACCPCGATNYLTLDHIFPWSRGGQDIASNLQTMCRSCNSRKGNKCD